MQNHSFDLQSLQQKLDQQFVQQLKLVLPLTLDSVPVKEQDTRLKKVAEILKIEKLLDKRTFEVSGGEAQRTAIARALIHNPSLLLQSYTTLPVLIQGLTTQSPASA